MLGQTRNISSWKITTTAAAAEAAAAAPARQRLRLGPARAVPVLGIPGGQLGASIKPPPAATSRGFFGALNAPCFVCERRTKFCVRTAFFFFFLSVLFIKYLPQLIRKCAELLPGLNVELC